MFCEFCGTQLKDNAAFCHKCGKCVPCAGATNAVNYSSLSLTGEIGNSKLLYVVPFVYLVSETIGNILSFWTFISEAYVVSALIAMADTIIFGSFFGSLAYAATKRTVCFTLAFMVPYFLVFLISHFIPPMYAPIPLHLEIIATQFTAFVAYVEKIILPFAVLGILRLLKILMKNIKQKWPLEAISVLVTIILFGKCWGLYTLTYPAMLVAGIIMSYILMRIVYRTR